MQDQMNATTAPKRVPWNKRKLTGAKPPLGPKHVWSIRTKLQIEGRARDLAMFNLAIDSLDGPRSFRSPLCSLPVGYLLGLLGDAVAALCARSGGRGESFPQIELKAQSICDCLDTSLISNRIARGRHHCWLPSVGMIFANADAYLTNTQRVDDQVG
jgi:hypothetical protein